MFKWCAACEERMEILTESEFEVCFIVHIGSSIFLRVVSKVMRAQPRIRTRTVAAFATAAHAQVEIVMQKMCSPPRLSNVQPCRHNWPTGRCCGDATGAAVRDVTVGSNRPAV
jgi:hypothetical protein